MPYVDFVSMLHKKTERDYLARVNEIPKAEAAARAVQWGYDYWDGDRKFGYGGYRYDGRWLPVAEAMAAHYGLESGDSVLDVGCGKAFILHEFTRAVPGINVAGIDVSEYAVEHAKEEVKPFLKVGAAHDLPYEDKSFDLVISINALHNLYNYDLDKALSEMERVGKQHKWLCVEAYRTEEEKVNLMYWQLTCRAFHTPEEWEWIFQQAGYTGDYGFIYFE
jgi:ubiquinone/menaquinone biosynthesis C-methylase UbiE